MLSYALGNYETRIDLDNFPSNKRDDLLNRYLVQQGRPIVYRAADMWKQFVAGKTTPQVALRQPHRTYEKSITPVCVMREAADLYYSKNQFSIRLDLLREFLRDFITGSGARINIAPLVRDISVTIDMQYYNFENDAKLMASELYCLALLENAKSVCIELVADGLLDIID